MNPSEVLPYVSAAGLLAVSLGLLGRKFTKAKRQPTPFVAGVCRSLRERPHLWDFNSDESWLSSEDGHLSISLQSGNYGRCNSYLVSNTGSQFMMQFVGVDLEEFKTAVGIWRDLTAIERQHTIERRKREALTVLDPMFGRQAA